MKKIVISLLLAGVVVSSVALADLNKHPHLKQARNQIDNAKKSLQQANDHEKSEFGGHREKAIELLNQAQQEIDQAATWADSHK